MAQRVNTNTAENATSESKFAKRHYVPLAFGWASGISAAFAAFVAWKNAALRDLVKALRQDSQWRSLDRDPKELLQDIMERIDNSGGLYRNWKPQNRQNLVEELESLLREDRWVRPYGSGHIHDHIHEPYDAFINDFRKLLVEKKAMERGLTDKDWAQARSFVEQAYQRGEVAKESIDREVEKYLDVYVGRNNIADFINDIYKSLRGHDQIEKSGQLRKSRKIYQSTVDKIITSLNEGLQTLEQQIAELGTKTEKNINALVELGWQKEQLFQSALQQSLEARSEYHKVLDKEVLQRLDNMNMPLQYKNLSQRDQFKTVAFAAVVGVAVGSVVATVTNWLVSAKQAQQQKTALKVTGIQAAKQAQPASFQDRLKAEGAETSLSQTLA